MTRTDKPGVWNIRGEILAFDKLMTDCTYHVVIAAAQWQLCSFFLCWLRLPLTVTPRTIATGVTERSTWSLSLDPRYDAARDSHANDAPLPVPRLPPACHPRDCQSSRLSVRTHRRPRRQITVGGRATIGGMPRKARRARRLRRRSIAPTIALTITEAGALFTDGDRQAYEAPRDVARHAIVRDRPPVERHAPRLRRPRSMGGRSPDFTTISRDAPLALLHPPFAEHRRWRTGLPTRFSRTFSLFPRPKNARWPDIDADKPSLRDVPTCNKCLERWYPSHVPLLHLALAFNSAFNRSRRCTRYSLFDSLTDSSSKHDIQRDGTWEKQRKRRLLGYSVICNDDCRLKNMLGN